MPSNARQAQLQLYLHIFGLICILIFVWRLVAWPKLAGEYGQRLVGDYKSTKTDSSAGVYLPVEQSVTYALPAKVAPQALSTAAAHSTDKTQRTKTIIAAALNKDNTTWIEALFPDWHRSVYIMDDPEAPLTVEINKGNEGAAYLSFIISHYADLPDIMVFIHGARYQWHNEEMMYDHVPVLRSLQLDHVVESGYASLRCTWKPGCPINLRPDANKTDGAYEYEGAYAKAWQHFWPDRAVPTEVGAPCCAQFAVFKAQVLKVPIEHYEKVRQWLWDTDLGSTKSGRIMEYMWHIIFGQDPVFCQDAASCFCDKFGLCDLDCPSHDSCEKRWWQPWPLAELPERWPEEGQGRDGWPIDGWWHESPGLAPRLVSGPPNADAGGPSATRCGKR